MILSSALQVDIIEWISVCIPALALQFALQALDHLSYDGITPLFSFFSISQGVIQVFIARYSEDTAID